MIAQFLRNKWVLLTLGILMLAAALIPKGPAVMCGAKEMRPGDTCRHTANGVTTGTYSYAQEKADSSRTGTALGWAGGAVTLGAIGWILFSMRRRTPAEGLTVMSPVS